MRRRGSFIHDWLVKPYSILASILGLSICIFGVAFYLSHLHYEAARNHALSEDKAMANLLANTIVEHEKAALGILQSYANRPLFIESVKKRDRAKALKHMVELKKNNPEIDLTFVSDTRGVIFMNFPAFTETLGMDLSHRDWYKAVSAHWKPYVSDVFTLIVGNKELAVSVCAPILDLQGRPIGILGNSQRLGFLADIVRQTPFALETNVTAIDRAGQIIYSAGLPYGEKIYDYPFFSILQRATNQKKDHIEISDSLGGAGKRHLTIATVKDIGWSVVIERTNGSILRAEQGHFVAIATVSFLLLALLSMAAFYMKKSLLLHETTDLLDMERTLREKEAALRKSEEHYRSLFDNMLNGFAYCRMLFEQDRPKDFIYLDVNGAFETLTGLHNVTGKKVSEVIPGIRESDPGLFEVYGRVASTGIPERFETFVEALKMWFSISVYRPQEECFVAVFEVITERKQAEETMRNSLEEKVALLKEVHHRVKNNLQIVASLLNLQANRSKNPQLVEVLQDTRNRVHSMALLHEVLYRSENLARINFSAYVEQLYRDLIRSFGPVAGRVKVENRVARIGLPLEQSIPCGLIINELMTNALKHAFPHERAGTITVELCPVEGQKLLLRVRDDGAGLPQGMDIASLSTLGLQLVSNLAVQLGGQLVLEKQDGAGVPFSVTFPVSANILPGGES